MKKRIHLYLPDSLIDQLQAYALKQNLTVSVAAQLLITEALSIK